QHVGSGTVEKLLVGDFRPAGAVDNYCLEILPPHHCTKTAPADRVPLAHHDICKKHPVLAGRTDSSDAASTHQSGHGLLDIQPPQSAGREESDCGIVY